MADPLDEPASTLLRIFLKLPQASCLSLDDPDDREALVAHLCPLMILFAREHGDAKVEGFKLGLEACKSMKDRV